MEEYLKSKDKKIETLDKIMSLDDTLPEVYIEKLKLKKDDIKLREKSFDVLDKDSLKQFGIKKKINYKELYFEIIDYLKVIKLDEPKGAEEDYDLENFKKIINNDNKIGKEEKDSKETKDRNKIIEKNKETEKQDLNDNLSDSEFQKILENKENFDVKKLLEKRGKVKVKDIQNVFNNIFEIYSKFSNYRNNYPDFESEYFYFNNLNYMLETFKSLGYKKFIKKIFTMRFLNKLTIKMKSGLIADKLIKVLYYYVMNIQYNFDDYFLKLLASEGTNIDQNLLEKNNFTVKNNNLYDKNNKLLLENVDNYLLNDLMNMDIFFEDDIDSYIDKYYSIKGLLNNLSFTKKDGDKFWEEFLLSKVLDNIVEKLYKKENIFKEKVVIEQFKDSSFYFPNYNDSIMALSNKSVFYMYFPPSEVVCFVLKLRNSKMLKMINRAANKVKIHQEWGHTSSSFLFFSSKIKLFDTPERNIKFHKKSNSNKNQLTFSEGGEMIEFMMYGRIIKDLNPKEAIFILNSDNYKLSLDEFYKKFKKLENITISEIFEEALKNQNIDEIVKSAFEEYTKSDDEFKNNLEAQGSFKLKRGGKIEVDLENFKIQFGKSQHYKYSHFINKNFGTKTENNDIEIDDD